MTSLSPSFALKKAISGSVMTPGALNWSPNVRVTMIDTPVVSFTTTWGPTRLLARQTRRAMTVRRVPFGREADSLWCSTKTRSISLLRSRR